MNPQIKSGILSMIAKQYGNPKKIYADCKAQELTIFTNDNYQRKEQIGYNLKSLAKVANAYGFKVIERIAIEFELKKIVLAGLDKNDEPKTVNL